MGKQMTSFADAHNDLARAMRHLLFVGAARLGLFKFCDWLERHLGGNK